MQGIILCTKRLLTVCLLLSGTVSQASMNPQAVPQDGLTQIAARTGTLSELAPAKIRTVPKPKVSKLLPKVKRQQQQLLTRHEADDNDSDTTGELDFQVGYRRPELVKDQTDDLSPYIADRLAQARELALAKYKEVWQEST